MNIIPLMLASYVARQVGCDMDRIWGQGAKAAVAHFTPAGTVPARRPWSGRCSPRNQWGAATACRTSSAVCSGVLPSVYTVILARS